MATLPTTDLSYNKDYAQNMAISTKADYIIGVLYMLFNMIPGTDEYDIEKGLDIRTKVAQAFVSGTEDTEYENKISEQVGLYTDLQVVSPIVKYVNDSMYINMIIKYGSDTYTIAVQSNSSLGTLINAQTS